MGTGSGEPQEPSSAVPADFKWETTRDLDISVGMPSVTGNTPQYAVIRVYCSPILSDGNIVAMGVVTPSRRDGARRGRQFDARLPAARGEGRG